MESTNVVPGLVPGMVLVTAAVMSATTLSLIGAPNGLTAVVGLALGVPGIVFLMNSVRAARRGLEELKREHGLD